MQSFNLTCELYGVFAFCQADSSMVTQAPWLSENRGAGMVIPLAGLAEGLLGDCPDLASGAGLERGGPEDYGVWDCDHGRVYGVIGAGSVLCGW